MQFQTNGRRCRNECMRVRGHGLSMAIVWNDGRVALFLDGDLDRRSAPLLAKTLDAIAAQHPPSGWLHAGGVERIDTGGIRFLREAHRRVADHGCELLIRSLSTAIGTALEVPQSSEGCVCPEISRSGNRPVLRAPRDRASAQWFATPRHGDDSSAETS